MSNPIAGVRVVVDTRQGVVSLQQLQQAAAATSRTMVTTTQSAASYSATVNQVLTQTATAANRAGQSVAATAPAWNKLGSALSGVALAAGGIPGPVGRVANALGGLALGGAGAAGLAVAGLGALVAAFIAFDAPVRAAREELKRFREEGLEAFKDFQSRSISTAGDQVKRAADDLARSNQTVARIRSELGVAQQAAPGLVETYQKELKKAIEDRTAAANALIGRSVTLLDLEKQAADERKRAAEAAEAAAKRAQAEAKALADRLQKIKDEAIAIRDAFAKGLNLKPTVVAPPDIVGQNLLGGIGSGGITLQAASSLENLTGVLENFRIRTGQAAEANEQAARAAEDEARAAQEAKDAEEDLARARRETAIRTAEAVAGLIAELAGFEGAASRALDGVVQLGSGLARGDLAGIITGAGGIVSALFSQDEARRLAAARAEFERAVTAFEEIGTSFSEIERAMRSMRESLGSAAVQAFEASGLGRAVDPALAASGLDTPDEIRAAIAALRELAAQSKKYRDEANETIASLERLLALEEQNRREIEAQARAEFTRLQEDLDVRRLAAEGRAAEAEALRRQLELERTLADLRARFPEFLTPAIEAEYRRIAALEAEAEAVRKATEEAERRTQEAQKRADVASSLTIRELQARGGLGQDVAAELRAAQNAAELEAKRREGYTAAELERVKYLQGLEAEADALAASQAAAERAAREAQEAAEAMRRAEEDLARERERQIELLRQETRAQEDLNARKLRAQGLDAAADELALLARQRQEVEDARGKGFSAALIADLIATQKLERDAFASTRAARQQADFDQAAGRNFGLTTPTFGESSGRVDLAVGVSESTVNRLAGLAVSQLAVQNEYLPYLAAMDRRLARLEALLARQSGLSPDQLDQILGAVVLRSGQAQGLAPTN